MSAIPTLDLAAAATVCPLCDVTRKPRAFQKLFGVPVCKKCFYKFANRRQLAYIIDLVLLYVLSFAFGAVLGLVFPELFISPPDQFTLLDGFWLVFNWLFVPVVFAMKDGFRGYSPGKWVCGVQVVDQITREPIGFLQSLKRNLILVIPITPLIIAFTLAKGRRWGDKWAHTEVVWKRYRFKAPFDRRGILCMKCGYDLTGNVSGRCPECGTDIPAPPRSAAPLVRPVIAAP
ncbi:MAG: RDD family protein [Planctomycetes bacterium]|nr:RDD family protein [Planctomycetota bacterium]